MNIFYQVIFYQPLKNWQVSDHRIHPKFVHHLDILKACLTSWLALKCSPFPKNPKNMDEIVQRKLFITSKVPFKSKTKQQQNIWHFNRNRVATIFGHLCSLSTFEKCQFITYSCYKINKPSVVALLKNKQTNKQKKPKILFPQISPTQARF